MLTMVSRRNNRSRIRFLSWNINDLNDSIYGKKTRVSEFCDVLNSHDIFCLQETKGPLTLPEYRCYNNNRLSSRSGGVCIGVHRSLDQLVTKLDCKDEDILAISIPGKLTGMEKDLVVINIYDSPENSSYKLKRCHTSAVDSTLNCLLDLIGGLQDCDLLILGDFNARTGYSNFITQNENWTDPRQQSHAESLCRASKDPVTNERGRKLLDLISGCNLTILNGNCIGDALGEPTCLRYNGSSVVDYIIASPSTANQMICMKVGDPSVHSDHRTLTCELKTCNEAANKNTDGYSDEPLADAPRRIRWDIKSSPEIFKTALENQEVNTLLEKLMDSAINSKDDVEKLNEDMISLYSKVQDICEPKNQLHSMGESITKNSKKRMQAKQPWFNTQCLTAKRSLRILARKYGKTPGDTTLRAMYYESRREYKKLLKRVKLEYIQSISENVLASKNISWDSVKKLKAMNSEPSPLGVQDIKSFYTFFKRLYEMKSTDSPDLHHKTETQEATDDLLNILNNEILPSELDIAIKGLKSGKAAGLDTIPNEYLKHSNIKIKNVLLRLLNGCLEFGYYPWTTTIITPLHKKGDVHNPDNYRAIAVGSNIGKLYSSILLERLLRFRMKHCPDTENQLGFKKGSQTVDHLFTLKTCIDKYVHRKRKRLYACFVDYRKAFDTVCRDALLFKLSKLGIEGKFTKCMSYMYKNSKARLKIAKRLSEAFDVNIGTEQGHPLSPELFKIYVHELSTRLNCQPDTDPPVLNGVDISHLLWADDLVLLSQTREGLQRMISTLGEYCDEWYLHVNIDKTAVMVFNPIGRQLKESHGLRYGSIEIPSAKNYCYLGIIITLSGSMAAAQNTLKQKGMRAYFAMKKYIDIGLLKKEAAFKLFDALILPFVSYGCELWLFTTNAIKQIAREESNLFNQETLSGIAKDPLERLHLSFLKWTMRVPKRTSNAAVWGDTGRHPLAFGLIKQVVNYYNKLIKLDANDSDCYTRHAFAEQKLLNLEWYASIHQLTKNLDPAMEEKMYTFPNATLCKSRGREWFVEAWNYGRLDNRKLGFYNTVKSSFTAEPYLDECYPSHSRLVALLRTSAHKLNIETGRYGNKRGDISNRCCDFCTTRDSISLLQELPFAGQPIIENEEHFLFDCPLYNDVRNSGTIDSRLVTSLKERDSSTLFRDGIVRATGGFIKKIWIVRFPEKDKKEIKKS